MGADIHMFLETRVGDGEWIADHHHVFLIEDKGSKNQYEHLREIDSAGRNYRLFGALADVRNKGPHAKGLPKDLSEVIRKGSELYGEDGHSHSWETLESLKAIIEKLGYYEMDEDEEEPSKWKTRMLSTDVFFDWEKYEWSDRPMPFVTVVNYGEKLIEEHRAEQILLNHTEGDLQVRVVFWFDN